MSIASRICTIRYKLMHECALFDLALALANTYLSIRKEIRPKDNSAKEPSYGECSNHWGLAFCPEQKTLIF